MKSILLMVVVACDAGEPKPGWNETPLTPSEAQRIPEGMLVLTHRGGWNHDWTVFHRDGYVERLDRSGRGREVGLLLPGHIVKIDLLFLEHRVKSGNYIDQRYVVDDGDSDRIEYEAPNGTRVVVDEYEHNAPQNVHDLYRDLDEIERSITWRNVPIAQ
ncbi:MAG TPA: hypothetical protein VFQ54_02085 [Thermomicrobiales bacterium]|nr:hypothetical protein [Thermomicrobiales bacterium]